jgi:hypothetical protein
MKRRIESSELFFHDSSELVASLALNWITTGVCGGHARRQYRAHIMMMECAYGFSGIFAGPCSHCRGVRPQYLLRSPNKKKSLVIYNLGSNVT